jgi:hypothetical protein
MHEDRDETKAQPTTWSQRHAASILTTLLLTLLVLVILIQVAC